MSYALKPVCSDQGQVKRLFQEGGGTGAMAGTEWQAGHMPGATHTTAHK